MNKTTEILSVKVTIMVTEEQLNAESIDTGGLDAMINWIYEGEIYDGYKVLDISESTKYKLVKKGK